MAELFDQFLQLRKRTEHARLEFIWTDLDVILTFAAIADTEYHSGNREHAERILALAEKGYSDMLLHFSKTEGRTPEIEGEFKSKFKNVRERLDGLGKFR